VTGARRSRISPKGQRQEFAFSSRRVTPRGAARGKALGNDLDALAKIKEKQRKPLIDRAKAGERVSARADSTFAFPA
jgi:hypothetical protein